MTQSARSGGDRALKSEHNSGSAGEVKNDCMRCSNACVKFIRSIRPPVKQPEEIHTLSGVYMVCDLLAIGHFRLKGERRTTPYPEDEESAEM